MLIRYSMLHSNVAGVRLKVPLIQFCSARKHASALEPSDRSMRRILHDDLHRHPCKIAIVQELSEREGRAPHLMFHYLSSKVILSPSLRVFVYFKCVVSL